MLNTQDLLLLFSLLQILMKLLLMNLGPLEISKSLSKNVLIIVQLVPKGKPKMYVHLGIQWVARGLLRTDLNWELKDGPYPEEKLKPQNVEASHSLVGMTKQDQKL